MPERSCVACREKRGKKELIRLICSGGSVKIDNKGKEVGRGAYLCPIRECWEIGLKSNRLEYALRAKLTLENRQVLVEYGKSLPKKGESLI
ncbi:MAG: YlxR family protein [Chloroflexi bacterium]|nr:YlxR family protein [Chloroflexota bacterium]